jgi:hypothetical protein
MINDIEKSIVKITGFPERDSQDYLKISGIF